MDSLKEKLLPKCKDIAMWSDPHDMLPIVEALIEILISQRQALIEIGERDCSYGEGGCNSFGIQNMCGDAVRETNEALKKLGVL